VKHAILGAGAVGGLMGTVLASVGEDVIVIVRPEKLSGYPPRLSLERPSGRISAPARAMSKLTEAVDVLWIATKTYQLQAALQSVESQPQLAVPLLNGVDHVALLRSRFGNQRVVPATIAVEAELVAPGQFLQRSPLVLLNLARSGELALGAVVARLGELGFRTRFEENEQTLLWGKLCFLAPFALVTSASGKNKGEIFADAAWKEKLHRAANETCAVANASGAKIDAPKLWAGFEPWPQAARSSMAKDLAAGRQLELDAIAGPIVRGGERYGIDVSTTAELIKEIKKTAV
jgi:2-dehydropantoate 2-reductase